MNAMFELQELSNAGLGFLAHIARGQRVAAGFWNWLRAACEAELARRATDESEAGKGFVFPNLSNEDARVIANEMAYLTHRLDACWDDDLVMLVAGLGLAANARTRELCSLN